MWESSSGFGSTDLKPTEYTPNKTSKRLSSGPSKMKHHRSKSKSQSQSKFLALPMEIKVLVYEVAIRGQEVHVLDYGDATRALASSYVSTTRRDDGWGEACDCDVSVPWKRFIRADYLLCVCQQM